MLVRSLRLAPIAFALFGFAPSAPAQLLREAHALVPASAEGRWSPVLADVTGDGRLDLLSCPGQLLEGRGDGGFHPRPAVLPGGLADQRYTRLLPVDADDDGDLDLFALGWTLGGTLLDRLFLNQGDAGFIDAGHLHPDGLSWEAAAGDLNGDGRTDLLMARFGPNGPSALYLGTAHGFVDGSWLLPPGPPDTFEVHLVDVELDGDLDVFLLGRDAAGSSSYPLLWKNPGNGHFENVGHQLPRDLDPAVALAVGDLDGDGAPDLVVSGLPGRTWINDGHGSFSRKELAVPMDKGGPRLADLDGDGALDLLMLRYDLGDVQYRNDGTGTLTPGPTGELEMPVLGVLRYATLGDLDADGDVDAFCTHGDLGDRRVHLNDGTGHFEDVAYTTIPVFPERFERMAAGDLDADGDPDLVLTRRQSTVKVAWNLGNGGFGELEELGFGDSFPQPFVEDIDGDGDLDLYVGLDDKNALLLNDGCGALTPASNWSSKKLPRTHALAVGDLNGDGYQDVYLGQDQRDGVLFGDGAGSYQYSQQHAPLHSTNARTTSVALGDLDGDGDLDAFTATDAGRPRLAINQGDGVLLNGPGLPGKQEQQAVGDVGMADVDGDGDLDLVLATVSALFNPPATNDVWINQGGLVFTHESYRLPPIADGAADLHAADLDLDGDVDLYFTNLDGSDTLLLNDVGGFFDPAEATLPSSLTGACTDLDGDGDPDVLGLDRSALHVLYSHAHQLSWARLPRVGEPPSLRLTGKPGERWMLVAQGYPDPIACGFGASGLRRVVAEGVLPDSGEVLVTVDELDQGSTRWRALFTGRGGRAHTALELTRRGSY